MKSHFIVLIFVCIALLSLSCGDDDDDDRSGPGTLPDDDTSDDPANDDVDDDANDDFDDDTNDADDEDDWPLPPPTHGWILMDANRHLCPLPIGSPPKAKNR